MMRIPQLKTSVGKKAIVLGFGVLVIAGMLCSPGWAQVEQKSPHEYLSRANIYLMAGDYRRAIEACQRNIDMNPSVEAYVYLAYVYQALDAYLDFLVKKEDYVKVEQLSLNLTARKIIDLIDPPNVMPRMAQELIHEGIRQQFDVIAAMANRLSRTRTDELWTQKTTWQEAQPDSWWTSAPEAWRW